ncbi:MAG: hypothetical protein WC767_02265 [Candidatus Paceibacterota bacterium]|jgi:hypothetical protein
MSLTDFKPQFDNAYQEIFQKVLVAKKIMNTRFEATLKYGESVERVAYDISNVRVRTVVRGSASTIDTITDSSELLEINLEKEAVFHISDGEVKQAGPLNPGEVIGGQVGRKVAIDLDARCFAEVLNASYDFDTGDLTTLSSNATPITLSSTTVPQLVSRAPAKLRRANNQEVMVNMAMVVDSYAASDIAQYLLGKNIDLAGAVFKNGYTDVVSNAEMYVTENLTGEAVLGLATTPTDGDTVTIGGVVFTFRTTLGSTAGAVLISGSADAARANLTALINTPGTTDTYGVALSAADQLVITDTLKLVATNNNTTNKMTIVGTGSGRLILAETFTDATDAWDKNFIHAYFGKKGAIDLVVQDMKEVDMRETADRRGTNVFSSYLAGVKTFADGAKKFLDVHIAA